MAIPDLLAERAGAMGDRPFLHFRDRAITFREMEARSRHAAAFLRDAGVGKGDRVCVLLSNRPEFLDIWFGLARLGGVMVPLSATLTADGFSYIINHCDARVMVLERAFLPVFGMIEKRLEKIATRIHVGTDHDIPPRFLAYPDPSAGRVLAMSRCPVVSDSDIMSVIYTSTGAGLPRGTMLPHFNYVNTGRVWADEIIGAAESDVFYTSLPLYQINAQATSTMGALSSGRPLALGENFVASRFLDEIRRRGATVFNLVGWMFPALMNEPPRPDDRQHSARIAFGGATPKDLWEPFEERFGVTLREGYGRAESGGVCLANNGTNRKVGSIGVPTSFCEVKIVDENDWELPAGTPGEIVVRPVVPNSIFAGYYNDPVLTRDTMRNDWFHSGDCGYVDEENYFFFLDRARDCIRFDGKIVPSPEIENVLNGHPAVAESAVVGVPRGPGQEDIRAFVVLKEGCTICAEEILEWCAGRMANYMLPRYVTVLDEMPKTMTQRIMKDRLRARPLGDCWDGLRATGLEPLG